jgi:hypothetical protein
LAGKRWPDFFVAGAAKAGTTSLHRYLDEHPQIRMYPEKENRFFESVLREAEAENTVAEAERRYLDRVPDLGPDQVLGDTDPMYLWRPRARERIHARNPEARIVIVLRDPVERAFSWWLMARREGWGVPPIEELVDEELDRIENGHDPEFPVFLPVGCYAEHVEGHLETFGEDQVGLVDFADVKQDTLAALEEIADFVGVDPAGMAEVDHETVHNPYGVPRNIVADWLKDSELVARLARRLVPEGLRIWLGDHVLVEKTDKPELPDEARRKLEAFYADEVAELEDLLGREIPSLRASWEHEVPDGQSKS